MNKKEIEKLLSEKNTPCVSIVIPTHRLSTYRQADEEVITKAIARAKSELEKKYSDSPLLDKILKDLSALSVEIDYTHLTEGLGIYISPNYKSLILFPFPVTEKHSISESFACRDLLFAINNVPDFYILSVSRKYVRLFTCNGMNIEEINNKAFPMEYHEEFEYAKTSAANSFGSGVLVGYEKDKSVLQEERLKEFLRIADKNLSAYIKKDTSLVIAGDTKELHDFANTTSYSGNVIGTVKGNYVIAKELINHAWAEVQNYVRSTNAILISDITELVGKKKAVTGIEDAWKAIQEGKGLKLIVEKDFDAPAYVSKDGNSLSEKKPAKAGNYIQTEQIVDELIKRARSKNGSVLFVENGGIPQFKGIALTLRYI